MNLKSVLFLVMMTTFSAIAEVNKPFMKLHKFLVNLDEKKPAYVPQKLQPEDRRKLMPMFPKNRLKFVITQPTPNFEETQAKLFAESPYLKKHVARKFKFQSTSTTPETVTVVPKLTPRAPLKMKANSYFEKRVTPNTVTENNKITESEVETATEMDEDIFDDTVDIETTIAPPKDDFKNINNRNLNLFGRNNRPKRYVMTNSNVQDLLSLFSYREFSEFLDHMKNDFREYIFLEHQHNGMEIVEDDLTPNVEDHSEPRSFYFVKRNVIEEEKIETTQTPDLYHVGRDSRLRENTAFSNIHH